MAFAVIRAQSRVGSRGLYKPRAGPPRGRRRQQRRRAPRSAAEQRPRRPAPPDGSSRPPALPRSAGPGPRGPPPPHSRFGSPARRAPGCCLPGGPGAAAAPGEPRRPAARPRRRRRRHGRQAQRADGHLLQLPGGDAALRVPGRRVPAARAARQAVQGPGPAAAAAPVSLQDAAGDLRRDPGGGGGGGVPHGGGEGQEVVPAEPGVPAPQHAEPVAAAGAAQQLQTEKQPGLQRLRLGPVRGAARGGDARVRGPRGDRRVNPESARALLPGDPQGPGTAAPRALGLPPRCEPVGAPLAALALARGRRERGRFPRPCKCLFFNSSQCELCCECVPGGAPALSRRRVATPCPCPMVCNSDFAHRSTVPPSAHPFTLTPTLSLNTFIIVRRGRWGLGRSAAAAASGGLIFIFALRWLKAFI
ncbi:C11orf96 isoform 1 [Pongo abelii]|uniref:C11orf96 isoform 1 n=1 Tax=Pongo abelii TaxID=9601 RepID=A0A2J8WFL9_PONAB|nr:C11orf96 isoform 1 [Pongo abelii]